MARSGSKNFSYTRNDIINAALRKIGEYDPGETPGGNEVADAAFALNMLVQDYMVEGADIWLREELTLFVQKSQQKYSIGLTGDHVTASYVETTLNGALATSDTAAVVDSITGVAASDYVGVKLDDGSIHWTTVNGPPATLTITLTTGVASAAADGNEVYAYTTKAYRPHSILSESISRRSTTDVDTTITLIGEEEYRNLTQKTQTGIITQIFYKAMLDDGSLYAWPTGEGTVDKVVFIANYYPDDFDSASDNADFPVEWGNALVYGLAASLGTEYGVPDKKQRYLEAKADKRLQSVLDFDVENAPISFARDVREA
jgi:hypothetical protein